MRKKKVRIGLFGGTFNPMHIGHVQTARNAQNIVLLDVVYCIPTGFAPHKDNTHVMPFDKRCCHIRNKLACSPVILLSTIEAELTMPSYTFRTLQYFASSFPYSEQFFISGSLDFLTIHSWEEGEYILSHTNYIIAPRNAVGFDDIKAYIEHHVSIQDIKENEQSIIIYSQYAQYIYMCIPTIPISSTEVRAIELQ